jgi:hypothetical protein
MATIIPGRLHIRRAECWYAVPADDPPADFVEYLHIPSPVPHTRSVLFKTICIDLTKTEDELLRRMHRTTRYELRRAAAEGHLYQYWHTDARSAVEMFCDFYERNGAQPSGTREAFRWCHGHATSGSLDLSRISQADGSVLAWHAHYRDKGHARLKYSVSLSRAATGDSRTAVGRANRLHHWEDVRRFKSEAIRVYDLGGWYAGSTDQKLLGINQFKEGLGGEVATVFHCTRALTTVGHLFLWAAEVREQVMSLRKKLPVTACLQDGPSASVCSPEFEDVKAKIG